MAAFTPLSTERLNVRKLEKTDAGELFRYRSLPEVYRFQTFQPVELRQADEFIDNTAQRCNLPGTWFQLAVRLKGENRLIGDIGLHFLMSGVQVEIGYTLTPDAQGKGYAREALDAVIAYLFSELGKDKIIASVDPGNRKSIRLLQRLGMREEAQDAESGGENGAWPDDLVFALRKEEWEENKA